MTLFLLSWEKSFGFVGLIAILALFTALLLSILHVAARLPNVTLRLIVAGIFGWIASHVILNIAAMTGLAPLTRNSTTIIKLWRYKHVIYRGGARFSFPNFQIYVT